MERALLKLARQLNQYDSASLSALWERYAQLSAHFEPTQRWEESVLAFCMIQSMHWKNQLFNAGLLDSQQRAEQDKAAEKELKEKLSSYSRKIRSAPEAEEKSGEDAGSIGGREKKQRRKVLLFALRDRSES